MGNAPKITTMITDTNDKTIRLTGSASRFVRYCSNAKATMHVIAQDGDAAIDLDLLIIDNGSKRGYATGSNDIYEYTFEGVESNRFTFYATDSKGNVSEKGVLVDMVDYVKLTCNVANSRPDASGDMTLLCSGSCFNGYFDKAEENINTIEVLYEYTGIGVDTTKYKSYDSGSMTVIRLGNTYSAYVDLSGLDYQATYSFTITAEDALQKVQSTASGIKSKPVFHWGENDFAFEVPVKFNSTEEMRFKGDLRLKGDGNYGNTLYFGDGKHCYISEPSDNVMNIHCGGLQINEKSVFGTWKPTLNHTDGISYTIQKGWYQKLGNVVTIGWQLKASIPSGQHTNPLVIGEIPFKPSYSAFGGGIARGVYVVSNKNFACWCVELDGEDKAMINARLQACNNTSYANLDTSSTIFYPYGGGEVTLAGTICYMTND